MSAIDPAKGNAVHDQATRGHRSTLVSQSVRLLCKVVSILIVARLVAPSDYGLLAMAASITLLLWMFRDLGLGTAAIQAPDLSPGLCASLFRAQLILGIALMLITCATSPVVAWFYGQKQLVPLLLFSSLSFLFIGIAGLPRTILFRSLRFDEINLIETISAITATTGMIVAAALGAGAYSLALFGVLADFIWAVFAWKYEPCLKLTRASRENIAGLAKTGRGLSYFQALNYLSLQAEIVGVGQYLGTFSLGLYSRATQMLALPTTHLAEPLSQVTLTALSRLASAPEEFKKQAASGISIIAYLVLPIAALCVAVPEEVVKILLGSQWTEAAPLLRWLAVSAALSQVTLVAQSIAIAVNQSHRLIFTAVVTLMALIAAVVIGLPHGSNGVALAVAVANLLLFLPRLMWRLQGSPVCVSDFLHPLAGPFVTALILGLGSFGGRTFCPTENYILRLLTAIAGGALFLGITSLLSTKLRNEWRVVWGHLPWAAKTPPTLTTPPADAL
ncbi:MAG: lipopolysaccharide biosynthesis protein [Verrucomicrobia bacterium]|nr:lipopolysaccharide biosynthesis protein [Verrucomicrobiota bacterium]